MAWARKRCAGIDEVVGVKHASRPPESLRDIIGIGCDKSWKVADCGVGGKAEGGK